MMKKMFYTIFALYHAFSSIEATLVLGDSAASTSNHTFSFLVNFAKYSSTGKDRLWIGTGEDLSGKSDNIRKFGLSYIDKELSIITTNSQTGAVIIPAARPLVNDQQAKIFTLNTGTNQVDISSETNPLRGSDFFELFTLSGTENAKPVFVLGDGTLESNTLYAVHDIAHYDNPTEEQKNITELIRYEFAAGQRIKAIESKENNIFAAHADGGDWGAATSTISRLMISSITNEEGTTLPFIHLISSADITLSTAALIAGGAGLASIQSNITLFHSYLATTSAKGPIPVVYAGLDVTANGAGQAAGATIINADADNNLTFKSIANDTVIAGGVDTAISAAAGNRVRITNIATMRTSSALDYLIVARDSGTGPQNIYALPIVSTATQDIGKIADVNSIINTYANDTTRTHMKRSFSTALNDADQINPASATPGVTERLTVGKGSTTNTTPPLAAGNVIKDLYTVGDSVYVVLDQSYNVDQQPGTFSSQAIFGQDGQIINWTPWSRALGSDKETIASSICPNATVSFSTNHDTGFTDVIHTQWITQHNYSPFADSAKTTLEGIQGIFSFGQTTPGFNNQLSFLIATGFNSLTIGQTGAVDGGFFKVKTMTDADVIKFTDIVTSNALVAAEFAHDTGTNNHWLFAGGASGLRVLTDDGTGITWNGNLSSVTDLNNGQTWKEVGDFSFVKKIIWDRNSTSVYILTNQALYKIELDPNKFTQNPSVDVNAQIIVESKNLPSNDLLLDCIIDTGFCILGTTNGLYAFDLSTTIPSTLNPITIPDGLPAVSQLKVISNGVEQQREFKESSNLLVLNGTFGTQQSRLNRFVITNQTLTPFADTPVALQNTTTGIPSSFIKFNEYISNYFTNGTWNLAATYFLGNNQPIPALSPTLQLYSSNIKSGQSSSHKIIPNYRTFVPLTPVLKDENVLLGVIQESTSGALIVSGSFGARVNA